MSAVLGVSRKRSCAADRSPKFENPTSTMSQKRSSDRFDIGCAPMSRSDCFCPQGSDSALVAALSARELDCQLSTYTVAFPDGVNEASRAAAIASHFHFAALHHRRTKECCRFPGSSEGPVRHTQRQFVGPCNREMSELAHDKIAVALSGSGGDELAFGYNKYSFLWKQRRMFKLPDVPLKIAKAFDGVLSALPQWRSAREYLAGDRTFRYIAVKNGGFAHTLDMLANGLPKIEIGNASRPLPRGSWMLI